MLKITNLTVKLKGSSKLPVLNNINLAVGSDSVHYISGRNGAGKSTLANAIMGNPDLEIISGKIELVGEKQSTNKSKSRNINDGILDLTTLSPNERSLAGIYLANQYPTEIPGVGLLSYLRLIYNIRKTKEESVSVFKFKKYVEELAELINYPKTLLKRNLNEGFSGGEKKKTEILQMLVLKPKYAILDEVDSGLDKQSIKEVFGGLAEYREKSDTAFIIISHYDQVHKYLKPDFVHEMEKGKMIS